MIVIAEGPMKLDFEILYEDRPHIKAKGKVVPVLNLTPRHEDVVGRRRSG
jgi:hypothetical protein